MAKDRLPTADSGDFVLITRATWNRVVGILEWIGKLTVAPPLMLRDGPGGPHISALPTSPPAVWIKLTSSSYTPPDGSGAITLGVGRFAGEILSPATAATDLTTNLVEADVGSGTGQIVVVYNMSEVGLTTRNLTATDLPYIVPAVYWRTLASGAPVYLFFDAQWSFCTS